ncbi:endonuclease/exonuclease/phosphatase family protein [Allorhodopirellula heiligendammensis]|uniref:Endonuclease/Exonuclease/phosphatase family protein n=1 Tax=Allorhodopirellula heiligendammensis TaxID=2714739 RepID=A0A5C6BE51_9BACT|nr:endonuclease/exonuclease/phosphatase family protein [Allorhodopirellula heiligendammensis]TWU10403.1 Endonuclease/Exonuclease/phosphatase family protein [Allorhodopirellula heiligendammensis]
MPISRRQFGTAIGASLALANDNLLANEPPESSLRVIAYNIYKLKGWPEQRLRAKQAVAEGQMAKRLAMELDLYAPDIINFSESPSENLTREVAEILGMNHVRFPSGGNWPGTLLSRFEIIESQNVPVSGTRPTELFTRHWGRATVQLPSNEKLIVHSAHLFPTADPTVRLKEIQVMIAAMKPDLDAGRSMLLIGDLNHAPDTEEHKLWIDAGWVDTFAKIGQGEGLTIKSDIPKWRIDYVMAAGPIADRVAESRPLFEGGFRLNMDDEQSFALSDHLPQLAVFESTQ